MTVQHPRSGLPLLAVALAVFAWGFGPLFVKKFFHRLASPMRRERLYLEDSLTARDAIAEFTQVRNV